MSLCIQTFSGRLINCRDKYGVPVTIWPTAVLRCTCHNMTDSGSQVYLSQHDWQRFSGVPVKIWPAAVLRCTCHNMTGSGSHHIKRANGNSCECACFVDCLLWLQLLFQLEHKQWTWCFWLCWCHPKLADRIPGTCASDHSMNVCKWSASHKNLSFLGSKPLVAHYTEVG